MVTKTKKPTVDGSRAKALFADVAERAKNAREQAVAGRTKLVAFNKDNVEALKASGRIAGTGAKALGQEVVANVKREFAAVSDGPKNFSGVKSCLEAARDDTKAFGQHLGKVAGDVVQPLKSRVAAVTAKPKAATVKLAKPVLKSAKSKAESVANEIKQLAA
jgi:hypothetical protein